MPPTPDYYATLEVPEDADPQAIKKAYRRLAREYHPDRNAGKKGAEEKFKEVQEAYDTLGDAAKRKQYDRARRNPFGGGFGGFPGGGGAQPGGGGRFYRAPDGTYVRVETEGMGPDEGYTFHDDGGGFGDLFGRFFGGGFGAPRPEQPPRGGDIETRLDLSFDKALKGGKSEVTLPDGEKVRINIQRGTEDGQRVRLKGRGRPGPTGQRGDLYITFHVRPSDRFERDGLDLATKTTINVAEAVLGTSRIIENAYGEKIKLTIPAGTQPGDRLRLRDQGVQTEKRKGALVVEVQVEVPRKLPDDARAGFEAWAKGAGLI